MPNKKHSKQYLTKNLQICEGYQKQTALGQEKPKETWLLSIISWIGSWNRKGTSEGKI